MQVWPKNAAMRKLLKHANGVGFREDGPADWPDDSFTARRVKDGDVLLKAPASAPAAAPSKSESKAEKKSD